MPDLRAHFLMSTPVLGSHLPTLRSLVEYACCIREGDAGLETAERILPHGGPLTPVFRAGTGQASITAKISSEYLCLGTNMSSDSLGKSDVRRVKGRTLKVANIMNTYAWHNYPELVADGEGDVEAVQRVLSRIDSIGVRRSIGWGWIDAVEVKHV